MISYGELGVKRFFVLNLISAAFFLVSRFYMLRCLFGALYVDMRLFGGLEACLCIKSDGLTKEDKAQHKNEEKANRGYVFPSSTRN